MQRLGGNVLKRFIPKDYIKSLVDGRTTIVHFIHNLYYTIQRCFQTGFFMNIQYKIQNTNKTVVGCSLFIKNKNKVG